MDIKLLRTQRDAPHARHGGAWLALEGHGDGCVHRELFAQRRGLGEGGFVLARTLHEFLYSGSVS